MPTPQELQEKLWKALKSDMTVMLGLAGVEEGHTRPMTAQIEGDGGPLWFFASTDNDLVRKAGGHDRAILTFASKGHDLFASIHGRLSLDNDRATIDRLWNPHVAAWYENGRNDPKIALLRMDPERAEIWESGSSLIAGIKSLFGSDPKKDFKDNVAEVSLR